MLTHFCLYGFLKNQKYYEPFFLLALLEKGCSFTLIGFLFAFRALTMNLLEIPSGALADCWGRRRTMVLSMGAYILSFLGFALFTHPGLLFLAMAAFAVGEAFRTGTHKAMIFTWLKEQGRDDEKTAVYGTTRSWSQMGSALSGVIAAAIVIFSQSFAWIFWASVLPYLLGILNLSRYPASLDGEPSSTVSMRSILDHTRTSLTACLWTLSLRRYLLRSLTFRGCHETTKDYIQPLLQALALGLPFLAGMQEESRTAVLVGAISVILYLLAALASKRAGWIAERLRGGQAAECSLQRLSALLYLILIPLLFFKLYPGAVIAFVLLVVIQNAWRPIYMGCLDEESDDRMGATLLSIDSQAKSLYIMVAAPLLGMAVDHHGLWPVAVLGAVTLGLMNMVGKREV
ncbi:MAG: MFS transporter [Planctomycetota bacterium]|jgi:MFS family permease